MDKTVILHRVRAEYLLAHKFFLAARIALRARPDDPALNARYQAMLRDVSSSSARLAVLEVAALRVVLESRDGPREIQAALLESPALLPVDVSRTGINVTPISRPFDGPYAGQLAAAIVAALDQAKALIDADAHGIRLRDLLRYARDLHDILRAQVMAATPGSVEQLRRLCVTMAENLAEFDLVPVRDATARAVH